MKSQLVILLLLIGFSLALKPGGKPHLYLVFDNATTKESLQKDIEYAMQKNINLVIETADFNKTGKLKSIKGRIGFPDGEGSFNCDKLGFVEIKQEVEKGGFNIRVIRGLF